MNLLESKYFTKNGMEYLKQTFDNGTVVIEAINSNEDLMKECKDLEPIPTQLDRIESLVAKSQEEIAQEARDNYTLELIEGGVIA